MKEESDYEMMRKFFDRICVGVINSWWMFVNIPTNKVKYWVCPKWIPKNATAFWLNWRELKKNQLKTSTSNFDLHNQNEWCAHFVNYNN